MVLLGKASTEHDRIDHSTTLGLNIGPQMDAQITKPESGET